MLWPEQFDSAEEYEAAEKPDIEHDVVREVAYEAATESFVNHTDITDLSTADPKNAVHNHEHYHDKLEEQLGRLPTKDEIDWFCSQYKEEYVRRMVKSGMVASREDVLPL